MKPTTTKKNAFENISKLNDALNSVDSVGPLFVHLMNAWKSLKILFFCYFFTISSILSTVGSIRTNKYFSAHKLKAEKIVGSRKCIQHFCFHSIRQRVCSPVTKTGKKLLRINFGSVWREDVRKLYWAYCWPHKLNTFSFKNWKRGRKKCAKAHSVVSQPAMRTEQKKNV